VVVRYAVTGPDSSRDLKSQHTELPCRRCQHTDVPCRR